jgi:transposase-like protein
MKEKKIKAQQRRKYDADFKQQVLQMIANYIISRDITEPIDY